MANKKFLLGILVMALVFGMTVVGCEEELDEYFFTSAEGTGIDNRYPVVGETITATFNPFINEYNPAPKGTQTWQWYKTEEDAFDFSRVKNKTLIGSGSTYTVKQTDAGFWLWAEVSYSGNNGTMGFRTSSTVIGIPATATVSVSISAYKDIYSSDSYNVIVILTLSDGIWDNVSYDTSQWIKISGVPDITLWYNHYKRISDDRQKLLFYYNNWSDTTLDIDLTATLDTSKLSTMRSSTNVTGSLIAGTYTASVSQWRMYDF
jgi:hypothetical protein